MLPKFSKLHAKIFAASYGSYIAYNYQFNEQAKYPNFVSNLWTQNQNECQQPSYSQWKKTFGDRVCQKAVFYKDFPKKGVNFMDLFSLTSDSEFFNELNMSTIKIINEEVGRPGTDFNVIVGLESRGFIQGPILAQHFNVPFVPIRKKGKLPGECF